MNQPPFESNGKRWEYNARTRTHQPVVEKTHSDNAACEVANVELPTSSKPVAACKSATFGSRVNITVVHFRTRLADPDGISIKAAIDGLVNCGILKDDSAKEIGEIRQRQVKVKNASEEKTEVIIEEV